MVIGAGIGGLTAGRALRHAGFDVCLFERARSLEDRGAALGIMSNAVSALSRLGVTGQLEARGQVIRQLRMHDARGRVLTELPLQELQAELGAASVSIRRSELQRCLLAAAEGCEIELNARCVSFDADARGVCAHFEDGRAVEADVLIGADGLHSAVRRQLAGAREPRYAGYVFWLATVPFRHANVSDGSVGLYWGPGAGFGLIDLGGGQVYWWATRNRRERTDPQKSAATRKRELMASHAGWADEVVNAIAAASAEDITEFDALDRPFLKRWGRGRVTLLGDAAHPMLTSLGQGACMAIEDAVVLGRSLAVSREIELGLRSYERLRRWRTYFTWRMSRIMAAIEQLEHPALIALRNGCWRMLGPDVQRAQTRPIFTFVDPVFPHR